MHNKRNQSPTLMDLLIATIGSSRSSRQFKSILNNRRVKRYKEASVRVALSRLHSKNYLVNSHGKWSVTDKGNKRTRYINLLGYIASPFPKNSLSSNLISFDIPENNRVVRTWLRNQLKIFGYTMLQQSLWIGPGPLPRGFMTRLDKLDIRKHIKTFKVTKINK